MRRGPGRGLCRRWAGGGREGKRWGLEGRSRGEEMTEEITQAWVTSSHPWRHKRKEETKLRRWLPGQCDPAPRGSARGPPLPSAPLSWAGGWGRPRPRLPLAQCPWRRYS